MNALTKLTELFRGFPGIGPRQARRFVYFLLSEEKSYLDELVRLIASLKKEAAQCAQCFRFFAETGGGKREALKLCSICADASRNRNELMVVSSDADLEAMERSGVYRGTYVVIGGTLSLIPRKNGEKLRLKELQKRAQSGAKIGTLKEVILAFAANPDGEHTSEEIKKMLSGFPIRISMLGRGLSTGSELEYADTETLTSALKNRSAT
ncbi:MAG: Recombination protein RecR [Parcubacteria group bacterium GW2011_GWF2_50_9]|nr:MAG: Recombination protein RecR [Parcubacteria group bacterium GW2011_GWF2_50_9]